MSNLCLASGIMMVLAGAPAALSQEVLSPEDEEAVSAGETGRYSLVALDGDVLRVDRRAGTVSVCRKLNEAWRCNPVPLAEDAYIAEINDLAAEVDRLTARLESLEEEAEKADSQLPPGSALDRSDPQSGSEDGNDTKSNRLTADDEEELDKVLDFTESAMRRLFGMVRELQRDLEGTGN